MRSVSIRILTCGALVATCLLASACGARAKAKMLADRNKSAANLRSICQAMIVYAADNNDQLPPSFAYVVKNGAVDPARLVDPRTGHTSPSVNPGMDIAAIEAELNAHCDYYYVGDGKNTMDENAIIAYDKGTPDDHRVVAFADCHAEALKLNSPEMQSKVDKANAARDKVPTKLPANLDGPPH